MNAKTFTIAAVTAIALGLAPTAMADNKGCSNATLKGAFSHVGSGVITAPPAAAGPIAGPGTETFTGTYTVNPDCTGTITAQLSIDITLHTYFVPVWTNTSTGTTISSQQTRASSRPASHGGNFQWATLEIDGFGRRLKLFT